MARAAIPPYVRLSKPISVCKMQALGNDFLLLEAIATGEQQWPELARYLCSRHYGLGADGLLVVGTEYSPPRLRMWNPDGTEDFCVNGVRCAARFLYDRGLCGHHFTLDAFRKSCAIEILEIAADTPPRIRLNVGPPVTLPSLIPMSLEDSRAPILDYPLHIGDHDLRINVVSTGVTHTVIFVAEEVSDDCFLKLSPLIENHPLFPERTCVLWTQSLSKSRLRIRIWERGVGETLGCGSGACAAAVVASLTGRAEDSVNVESSGGSVDVSREPDGSIVLAGTAHYIGFIEIRGMQ